MFKKGNKNIYSHRKSNKTFVTTKVDNIIDEITSNEDDQESVASTVSFQSSIEETAQVKRRRLAKEYLQSLGKNEDTAYSSNDRALNGPSITSILEKERLCIPDTIFDKGDISDEDSFLSSKTYLSSHKPLTSVDISINQKFAVAGSKDGSVVQYDLETGQKIFLRDRQSRGNFCKFIHSINCVSISSNEKNVVSGGNDKVIRVYDIRCKSFEIHKLEGHRDGITGVTFGIDGLSLFSSSLDRCIKHWDMKSFSYIETMFGHQAGISSIDSSYGLLSCSSDRTIRLWNSTDNSHNVYRASLGGIDCVRSISNDSFVSGGQDGNIQLWKRSQKKPVFTLNYLPHGRESCGNVPRWISALSNIKRTNIISSGSSDGFIHLYRVDETKRSIKMISSIVAPGIVNGITMSSTLLVAALGKEHRLGRWKIEPGNLNKLLICSIKSV